MNKIRVIDLLNMVYNDELKENTLIKFNYDNKSCEYWRYINGEFILFYDKGKSETDGKIDIMSYLTEKNATIEIIEDNPSKIEEISYKYVNTYGNPSQHKKSEEPIIDKVNELVRVVNDLVERSDNNDKCSQ